VITLTTGSEARRTASARADLLRISGFTLFVERLPDGRAKMPDTMAKRVDGDG
jgi:hypothetical protein